jgi:hypothetical protein
MYNRVLSLFAVASLVILSGCATNGLDSIQAASSTVQLGVSGVFAPGARR